MPRRRARLLNNLAPGTQVEQVPSLEGDEDQATSRLDEQVAERVEEGVADEIGNGERLPVHADEAGVSDFMRSELAQLGDAALGPAD